MTYLTILEQTIPLITWCSWVQVAFTTIHIHHHLHPPPSTCTTVHVHVHHPLSSLLFLFLHSCTPTTSIRICTPTRPHATRPQANTSTIPTNKVRSLFSFSFLYTHLHAHNTSASTRQRGHLYACPSACTSPSYKSSIFFFFLFLPLICPHTVHPHRHATHPHPPSTSARTCNASTCQHVCMPCHAVSILVSVSFFFCFFVYINLHPHACMDPPPISNSKLILFCFFFTLIPVCICMHTKVTLTLHGVHFIINCRQSSNSTT